MAKITVIQSLKGCLFRWLVRKENLALNDENRRIFEILKTDPEVKETHPEYFAPGGTFFTWPKSPDGKIIRRP